MSIGMMAVPFVVGLDSRYSRHLRLVAIRASGSLRGRERDDSFRHTTDVAGVDGDE